jgi:hypothetical protein
MIAERGERPSGNFIHDLEHPQKTWVGGDPWFCGARRHENPDPTA